MEGFSDLLFAKGMRYRRFDGFGNHWDILMSGNVGLLDGKPRSYHHSQKNGSGTWLEDSNWTDGYKQEMMTGEMKPVFFLDARDTILTEEEIMSLEAGIGADALILAKINYSVFPEKSAQEFLWFLERYQSGSFHYSRSEKDARELLANVDRASNLLSVRMTMAHYRVIGAEYGKATTDQLKQLMNPDPLVTVKAALIAVSPHIKLGEARYL